MSDVLDGAIDDPDRDRLGMKVYAEQLARLIAREPAPFTIGVYGEWGTGKTSFVKLVSFYLRKMTNDQDPLITFSAWRYKTADEIWRALLLEIARVLYKVEPVDSDAAPTGTWQRISRALKRDALVVREASADDDPQQENRRKFQELAAKLGTFTERVGHASSTPRLDAEAVGVAIAKSAELAAGAAAPWVGWLRALLGLDAKLKPEQLLRAGELTPERVASTDEFLHIFTELVNAHADDHPVCVFVDDLDRCMPDTALEVLEAIKLYLGDARCIFIVAADQQLISHGLQLRFRAKGADKDDVSLAKGREYFEKIIQLGISVPQRTYENIHALVSARFPEWTPATDIIHAAVGSNPRRVKQHCTWLRYRHAVVREYRGSAPGPADPQPSASLITQRVELQQLFTKLVELRAWTPDCADTLLELAAAPDGSYGGLMKRLESALRARREGMTDEKLLQRARLVAAQQRKRGPAKLDRDHCKLAIEALDQELRDGLGDRRAGKLYNFAVDSTPVRELFCDTEEPILSAQTADRVAVLLRLAAVRPERNVIAGAERAPMLYIKDAAFAQIANSTASIAIDARSRIIADLTRWITLLRSTDAIVQKLPGLVGRMAAHTSDTQWNDEMTQLEACLDARRLPDDAKLSPEARALWTELRHEAAAREFRGAGELRFSTMLRQEVEAFARLERVDQLPPLQLKNTWSEQEEVKALAAAAIDASAKDWAAPDGFAAAVTNAIKELQLRIDVAGHLRELRSFAKLDALNTVQRERGAPFHADRAALNELERSAAEMKDDVQLQRLLQLRPRFSEISDALIAQYFQTAQELVTAVAPPVTNEAPPVTAGAPPVTPHVPAVAAMVRPVSPAAAAALAAPAPVGIEEETGYDAVTIELTQKSGPVYTITLTHDGTPIQIERVLDTKRLMEYAEQLNRLMPDYVTRDIGKPEEPERKPLLKEIGTWTYDQVFCSQSDNRANEKLRTLLKAKRNLRIAWQWNADLARLPWETLYLPPIGPFLGLNRKVSLVRYHPVSISGVARALQPPLRVLAVMASPRGAPPLNIEREREMLEDTLGRDPRVRYEFLTGDDATPSNLYGRLREFQPQVLHVVAHGFHTEEFPRGALLLSSSDGTGVPVPSEQFSAQFGGALQGRTAVQVAVLNSCDTGRSRYGDAVSGIAGDMVVAGVPAVIATTRRVLDPAAILFTREFYRTYLAGYPLDAALVEARQALNANGWDWSAYTLLTGAQDLDQFTLGPPPAPRSNAATR